MAVLDLLFPKSCLGCGKKGYYFCPDCRQKIRQAPPSWPAGPSLNGLFSFFAYEGITRSAIHKLKYGLVTDLEKEFWQIIEGEIEKRGMGMTALIQFVEKEKPTVVPIPLYWYKQNLRGFNQSSLFGKRIAGQFNLPFSEKLLVRGKNTVSQTKLSQKEREQNIKGIFRLSRKIQDTKYNILLVDDVWTTGSTMKEAAGVLKKAGVKKVWGLTVAR